MDRKRLKRSAWVGALGVALVVVIALLTRGGAEQRGVSAVDAIDPGDVPPPPGRAPPASLNARRIDPSVLETATGTVVEREDPKTRRLKLRFMAEKITPLPRYEMQVQRPQIFLFLSPSRVIHLVSGTGHFVAPGNTPQSGEFKDNLVLTVFDSGSERPANLSPDSPDRVLRLELPDGAIFDATRGEVRSAGPVHLVTPGTDQAELSGRGLYMIYNEIAERIDRLVIDSVQVLRLRPGAPGAPGGSEASGGPGGSEEPSEARNVSERRKGTRSRVAAPKDGQLYRFSFERSVRVESEGELIEADQLEAYVVVVDSGARETGAVTPGSGDGRDARATRPEAAGDSRSPAPAQESRRGIEITGGGKLVMEPSTAPAEAKEMDEVFLRFTGAANPVRVELRRSTSLTAQRLDYLDTGRRLTAVGSEAHPLRLDSPQLGRAAALRLVLKLDEQVGRLEGPGYIRAVAPGGEEKVSGTNSAAETVPDTIMNEKPRALPPDFDIVWSNNAQFEFDTAQGEADPALRSVTFIGAVRIAEPRFALDAEQVTAKFALVEEKSELAEIEAIGNVNVEAPDGAAQAEKLWMELDPVAGGSPRPRRLIAEGSAGFASKEGAIAGEYLDVVFLAEPAKEEPKGAHATEESAAGRFAADVATITARRKVRLIQKDVRVMCDRLDADNTAGTAVLTGSVTIERDSEDQPPFKLGVDRLELDQHKKTAYAPSGGLLTFTRATEGDEETPLPISVRWSERMSFDDAAGLVQVTGNVVAEEMKSATEMHTLRAEQLTLELVDPIVVEQTSNKKKKRAKAEGDLLDADLSGRQVKRLVARTNVRVEAREGDANRPGRDLWRFTLRGDRLEYTLADEMARMIGPGKMLIEDYRPAGDKAARGGTVSSADSSRAGSSLAQVSGRGQTLFTWSKELTFDKINGKMTLDQGVQMTHIPDAGAGPVTITLDADRLIADMRDSSKVEVIGMRMGSLDVDHIEALGDVQIKHGTQHIVAHRIYYDGEQKVVTLSGEPQRPVEFTDLKSLNPVRGRVIRWNLETGRREIVEPAT